MNKTNNTNSNKNQELGALWKKKSKAGLSFLSGYILDHDGTRTDIVVFANSNKSNEKAPDYRLYISKPLESKLLESKKTPEQGESVSTKKPVQEDEDDIL
jgi:uncharacterized protein (DUF736 family)